MADSYIALDEPAVTDKKLDTEQLTVGANTVQRERMQIAGAAATEIAPVSATDGLLVNLGANNDVTVAGVATAANQTTIIGHVDGIEALLTTLAGAVAGTEVQVDVLTSALPSGAATAAKQPALGTAGTASADVISVQGIASMTPVLVTASAGTNLNTSALALESGGNLAAAAASLSVVDDWDNAASDGASVSGDVAHGGADAGEPVKVGGKAVSAEPTPVDANDRANLITDLVGKLITLPYSNPENFVSGAITSAMTGTTSTSLIAAPAAGLRNYITQITVSNAHATVGTDVVIQDGSGGTTLYTIPAAALYGGAVIMFPTPLRQPTTATAIFCANVTTGASTKVSASGYKGV